MTLQVGKSVELSGTGMKPESRGVAVLARHGAANEESVAV